MSVDQLARQLATKLWVPTDMNARGSNILDGEDPAKWMETREQFIDAFKELRAEGGGVFRLEPGKEYDVGYTMGTTDLGGEVPISGWCHLAFPAVDNMVFDGNGATVGAHASPGSGLLVVGEVLRTDVVTGPMAVGAKTFVLATPGAAADYEVDDTVLWRLGDEPLDQPETHNSGFARVASRDLGLNTVTVDRPLARAWDGTGSYNKHLLKLATSRGQRLEALTFKGDKDNPNTLTAGLSLVYLIDPYIPYLNIRECRVGCGVQYVEGAHFGFVRIEDSINTGVADSGQGIRFAESSAYIEHLETRNIPRMAIGVETGARVVVGYHHDVCINPVTNRPLTVANLGGTLHIESARYEGAGGFLTYADSNGGQTTFGNVRIEVDSPGVNYMPLTVPVPGRNVRRLSMRIADVEELYDEGQAQWWVQCYELIDGLVVYNGGPSGLCSAVHVYLGGGASAADFLNLEVGRQWTGGTSILPYLPPADQYEKDMFEWTYQTAGGFSGLNWVNRHNSVSLYINCKAAGVGAAGNGKFIMVRYRVCTDLAVNDANTGFKSLEEMKRNYGLKP